MSGQVTKVFSEATSLGYYGLVASAQTTVYTNVQGRIDPVVTLNAVAIMSVSARDEDGHAPAESITIRGYEAIAALYEFLGEQLAKVNPPPKT